MKPLGNKTDETIYTHNDKHKRWFVEESKKGGRGFVYNHYCKSKPCENFLKGISEELKVHGNFYYIINDYRRYKSRYMEKLKKNMIVFFVIIKIEMMTKRSNFNAEKPGDLPIDRILSRFDLSGLSRGFDAAALYLSAIWADKPLYPKN